MTLDIDVLKKRMQPYRLQEISPGDYDGIWSLYTSVGSYFRRVQPFPSSLNEALADLGALPPGVEPTAKHTFALYEKDQLIALLDFIWNYPAPNMMYLGLLLVHGTFQGKGIGSMILRSLETSALEYGCKRIWVVVAECNLSARLFFQSKGFDATGMAYHRSLKYLVMEKSAIPTT